MCGSPSKRYAHRRRNFFGADKKRSAGGGAGVRRERRGEEVTHWRRHSRAFDCARSNSSKNHNILCFVFFILVSSCPHVLMVSTPLSITINKLGNNSNTSNAWFRAYAHGAQPPALDVRQATTVTRTPVCCSGLSWRRNRRLQITGSRWLFALDARCSQ